MINEEKCLEYMKEKRQELIDFWEDYKHENHEVQYYDYVIDLIENQPSIVKCKDCKFWSKFDRVDYGSCKVHYVDYMSRDQYCSKGVKKNG